MGAEGQERSLNYSLHSGSTSKSKSLLDKAKVLSLFFLIYRIGAPLFVQLWGVKGDTNPQNAVRQELSLWLTLFCFFLRNFYCKTFLKCTLKSFPF